MADDVLVERTEDLGSDVKRWTTELEAYDKASKDWSDDAKRVLKVYSRAKGKSDDATFATPQEFNILWSSLQIQAPAVFSRAPVPDISRRWKDKDDVSRISAMVLERAVSTDLDYDDIKHVLDRVSFDFQTVGRGVPWVRYDRTEGEVLKEAYFATPEDDKHRHEVDPETLMTGPAGKGKHIHEALIDPISGEHVGWSEAEGHTHMMEGLPPVVPAERDMMDADGNPLREVVKERAPVEYVHWKDFAHKPVKSWEDLRRSGWVARRVQMTKQAGLDRFGPIFKDVPLNRMPSEMSDDTADKEVVSTLKEAEVWEIWNAGDRKVYWICKDYKEKPLDVKDDPFGLEGFFPCPRPVFTSLTNEGLIPTPDYMQFESLSLELDDLTERIGILTRAIKVRGIYDSSLENLASLLNDDGKENDMLPVENMAAYFSKGSTDDLKGVVQFLPIRVISQVLIALYDARERTKQLLFEISGISDIVRGQVDPREKLGQSEIKGRFATLRLSTKQEEVARLARDTIRIKCELIAEHFTEGQIREISGFDSIADIVKLHATERGQEAEQLFRSVIDLIRSDRTRGFRIDIETDSTVTVDPEQDKGARNEFIAAVGAMMEKAIPAGQGNPAVASMMATLIMFGIRGFKTGRAVEGQIEEALEQMVEAAAQPQPPDPRVVAEGQRVKLQGQEIQRKAAKDQMDHQVDVAELGLKRETETADVNLRTAQMVTDAATAAVSDFGLPAGPTAVAPPQAAPAAPQGPDEGMQIALAMIGAQSQAMTQAIQTMQQAVGAIGQLAQAMSQPKQIVIERGPAGEVLGGTTAPATLQ